MNMKNIIYQIKTNLCYLGSALIYLTGGFDKLFIALLVFIALDYITGIIVAIKNKKLSSKIGLIGFFKKVMIIIVIFICNIIDDVISADNILRNFIILYYICNEGISILENSTVMGVKTPNKIKDILLQLQSESEEKINK